MPGPRDIYTVVYIYQIWELCAKSLSWMPNSREIPCDTRHPHDAINEPHLPKKMLCKVTHCTGRMTVVWYVCCACVVLYCTCRQCRYICVCKPSMNHISTEKAGLDVIQSHPLHRTYAHQCGMVRVLCMCGVVLHM